VPPSYLDLGHFVLLMQANTQDDRTKQAADGVIASLKKVILTEKHGASRKGSTGLAFYFPNSTLYSSPVAGPQSYTGVAEGSRRNRCGTTSWHSTIWTATSTSAPRSHMCRRQLRHAGAGRRADHASNISASSNEAAPNQPVKLSVDVSGTSIGYIKLFVGYFDPSSNSLNVTDTDYLESPETQQIGGVFYPVWPQNDFT